MANDPRSYLLDRFVTDAATLRARAEQLAATPPRHGPDAAASRRMATACDDIAARLRALPEELAAQLDGLDALGPALRALADRAPDAFVRSVYGGAATRIADVAGKERAALDGESPEDDARDDEGVDDDAGEGVDDDS
jgi:hypothetical protein